MKKQLLKKKRIATMLIISFFAIIIFQAFIFFLGIFLIDSNKALEKEMYQRLYAKTQDKAKLLENTMTKRWTNKEYTFGVVNEIQEKYEKHKVKNTKLILNEDLILSMVDMMHDMHVNGSFIILDKKINKTKLDNIVYLEDSNIDANFEDLTDIIMLAGNNAVARNLRIALSDDWNYFYDDTYGLKKDFYEYFNSLSEDQKSGSGKWYTDEDIFPNDHDKIYFMMPIFDKKTLECYAIIGVSIDKSEIIHSILDYTDLYIDDSSKSAYMLAKQVSTKDDIDTYIPITVSGPLIKNVVKRYDMIYSKSYKNKYYSENNMSIYSKYMYDFNFDENKQFISIKIPIRLYSKALDTQNDSWYIISFVDKNEFSRSTNNMYTNILYSVILSIILAIILSYFVSNIFLKPLNTIARNLENYNNKKYDLTMERTNITEYDNIINVMEKMSRELIKSSKRFQRIIETSSVSLVAVEINERENKIHKMGIMSRILKDYMENEPFEETFIMNDNVNINNMFDESKVINKYYNKSMDFTVEIIEKLWKDDTRYIKVITKIIDDSQNEYDATNNNENRIILKIIADTTREVKETQKIVHERNYDPLTGLLNRLSFKEKVNSFIHNDKGYKLTAAMVMWDLDDLKYINDTYGHDYGDLYIKHTGKIIDMLKNDNTLVARISGDEFFAFIPYEDDKKEVIQKLNKIREDLLSSNLTIGDNTSIKIRLTTGISWYPQDADNYDELMKYTDFAMYTAKHSKKGNIEYFKKDLYEKNHILLSGKENLNRFVEERQVKFAFQPIVDAKTGDVFSYEALMRPTSDYIKTVYDVLRLAKSQSKLEDIEILTWSCVLKFVSEHIDLFNNKKIFINSLPNAVIPDNIFNLLADKYHDIFKNIVIELLEQGEVDDYCMNIKQNSKKEYDLKIAIDDFGSGYATESRLLDIKPDFVKIDMTITRDIDKDKSRQIIVENILKYTHEQNIKVISEGVETYEELEQLIKMGVDYVQGYYIMKPNFEIKDIDKLVRDNIISLNEKYNI